MFLRRDGGGGAFYDVNIQKDYDQGRRSRNDEKPNGDANEHVLKSYISATSPSGAARAYNLPIYRCGGGKRTIATSSKQPAEGEQLVQEIGAVALGQQTRINALADCAAADGTIKLLLESLGPENQYSYLMNWEFRQECCAARRISPWLNTHERGCGSDLRSYLTWVRRAMGSGWNTLASRLSALRH